MARSWIIYTEVLLIFIFPMFHKVSLYIVYCENYTCYFGYCCFDTCCFRQPEKSWEEANVSWFLPVFAIFGTFVGLTCIFVICVKCHKKCKEPEQAQTQEPTANRPIPPPPMPTAPPVILASDPPPYSEVIGKLDFYTIPVGEPPCYENIAMEDLFSLESAESPCLRMTPERPSASAAAATEH